MIDLNLNASVINTNGSKKTRNARVVKEKESTICCPWENHFKCTDIKEKDGKRNYMKTLIRINPELL